MELKQSKNSTELNACGIVSSSNIPTTISTRVRWHTNTKTINGIQNMHYLHTGKTPRFI